MVKVTREDIQRRKDLNASENPRITVPNEASQMLNPITGLEYETDSTGSCFWKVGYATSLGSKKIAELCLKERELRGKETYSSGLERYGAYSKLSKRNADLGTIGLETNYVEEFFKPKSPKETKFKVRAKPYEETTDYLEMQKRLGQMELRQRSESEQTPFSREDYIQFADDLVTIVGEFDKSDILTLFSMRDATGLDKALKSVEGRRPMIIRWLPLVKYILEKKKIHN